MTSVSACRIYTDRIDALLFHEVAEDTFRRRRAADISVAHKKNLIFLTGIQIVIISNILSVYIVVYIYYIISSL